MIINAHRLSGDLVKKSNALARAQWQPESIWEPRIVALVASKVRIDDEDFHIYKIPVTELIGIPDECLSGSQYHEIRKSIFHLGKTSISIEGNNPRNFRQYSIFSMCGYENGNLIARFDPELKPHFLGLKEKFTEYSLIQFLRLKSSYSQHIFEFLKSWSNIKNGEITVLISDLHEFLNTPESFRKDFRQFRIYVLEKAKKDITERTDLRYEWEPIKQGRCVHSIRFIFSPKKALPVLTKKYDEAIEKKSQRNNRFFKIAISCVAERGTACTGGYQKEDICDICRKMR